ncbi:MAG: hypothetical protein K0R57_1219 [Paenibacillaceae bacterium]|jgi:AraC-like DNA-binding protein|nr:hypothetical protein [Paenibacillaceae bacterium]
MSSPLLEEKMFTEGPVQFPFICDIQQVGEEGFAYPAHWHHHIELIYMFEGRAQWSIGGRPFLASAGELLLINAHEVHSVKVDRPSHASYLVISCIPEILYNTGSTVFESKYILPFLVASHSFPRHFAAERLRSTPVSGMMQQFYHEYMSKPYGYELAIRSDMMRLFLWILREWQGMGHPLSGRQPLSSVPYEQFGAMFDYVRQHYSEPLSPVDAASMCSMSYSHFARVFKALTGRSFNEYLNFLRVSEAEKLLLTTGLNVTEVAHRTGFANSSYFIKQFKSVRGVSPKQFMKEARGGAGFEQDNRLLL